MSSIYPTGLPGHIFNHDPTNINYRKSSYSFQEKKTQGLIKEKTNYNYPDITNYKRNDESNNLKNK